MQNNLFLIKYKIKFQIKTGTREFKLFNRSLKEAVLYISVHHLLRGFTAADRGHCEQHFETNEIRYKVQNIGPKYIFTEQEIRYSVAADCFHL
jgi:hypothetical protein